MKVLYYIHALVVGGAETIATNYLIALKSQGIETVLVVNQHTDTYLERKVEDAGIKIYALDTTMPEKPLSSLIWKVKIRFINYKKKFNKIISIEKPDIIHVHSLIDRLYGVDFPTDRIIYTFHADVERALRIYSKKNYKALKSMSSLGLSFFAITDKALSDIKKTFDTDNVYKLPNAVDIDKIKNQAYARSEFLSEIDVPDSAFVLGHVGRFHKVKNHKKIIDVFNELHKKQPNSYLILVGGYDGENIESIHELIRNFGLDKFVRFLGVREDATSIMNCFDAFILPSFSEMFSLVLLEAQILGVRCVASDRVPEDVFCNNNCFRVSLDKSDEYWADLLLGDSITNETKDVNQFDYAVVISKLIEYYEKISGVKAEID